MVWAFVSVGVTSFKLLQKEGEVMSTLESSLLGWGSRASEVSISAASVSRRVLGMKDIIVIAHYWCAASYVLLLVYS